MIQFKSILDGMKYVTSCPFCKSKLEISSRDAALQKDKIFTNDLEYCDSINFEMDSHEIVVDINSNKVISFRELQKYNLNINGTYNNLSDINDYFWNHHNHMPVGIFLLRLGIDCISCRKYNYLLQIHLKFDSKSIEINKIVLNSELLQFPDNILINNNYIENKTYYNYGKNIPNKIIDFYLLPINHQNPQDILNKIKKLLPFA